VAPSAHAQWFQGGSATKADGTFMASILAFAVHSSRRL
jgi:hypothetical protein